MTRERIDLFKLDIRDHFAGLAMQSYIAIYIRREIDVGENCPDDDQIAEYAYHQADAMIKQRSTLDE